MRWIDMLSVSVAAAILSGCASSGISGAKGPELVTDGYATQNGSYARVGVKFTTPGDFFALLSPGRWVLPVETGGAFSWINPAAWSEDPGRTARILFGEAVLVGGVVAVSGDSGGSGGGNGSSNNPPPPGDDPPSLPGGIGGPPGG